MLLRGRRQLDSGERERERRERERERGWSFGPDSPATLGSFAYIEGTHVPGLIVAGFDFLLGGFTCGWDFLIP